MAEKKPHAAATEDRIPFGVEALDKMLDGGLMPRRPYLIVGPSGTGKTSLALQFLCEGVRRGESVLYVTLEDPPNEIRRNHRQLRPEIDKVDVFDAIPDVMRYERIPFKDISSVRDVVSFSAVSETIRQTPEFTSTEVTIAALEQFLRTQTLRRGYSRMVIDSLTALQYFCMKGLEPVLGAQTFLRFLSDLKVTTVLTVESPLEGAETPERMLARGEIRMFRWEREGVTVRAIGVEKFRGSAHDTRMHPYRIGPKGIDINLDVTVSRDTRDIAEPAYRLIAPVLDTPLAELEQAAPPSLFDSVRDLVELRVDVRPLRAEVEAAIAAVRSGRPDRAADHVSRASSLAIALAQVAATSAPSAQEADADVLRRVSERAERARVGRPPLKLPASEVLRGDLERVLGLLPTEVPALEAVPAPEPSATLVPTTRGPEPTVATETPPVPVSAEPTVDVGGVSLEPSAAVPDPNGRARPIPPPPKGISEPPPLPTRTSLELPATPASGPSGPSGARPRKPRAAAGSEPAMAPPLPEPLPPVSEEEIAEPTPASTEKPPARRRRKTATTKGTARAAGEEGATAAATKPKRRVVRRSKKAPPVVSATAEPLPAPEEAPPSPSTEPSPPSGGP